MKKWLYPLFYIAILVTSWCAPVFAQGPFNGYVLVPNSSLEATPDVGRRAHTNHLVLQANPFALLPSGVTPDEARAAYGLPTYDGGTAGSQVIAIVDAFDYPDAEADFNTFSQAFGLPQETGDSSVFEVVYATGTQPKYDSGWSQEAALDIEWAHAMAPSAKIVLVEAASSSYTDLLYAVSVASAIPGIREVSMSWGGSEFSRQLTYDSYFNNTNIVYFAASGDTGGKVIWPGTSPNVVAAGGTTLNLDSAGNFISETAWSGSGGGKSRYELRPAYQNVIKSKVGSYRGTPDLSFDANPYTGVSVYWEGSWLVFGGTSVSSPALAGIVNLAASSGGDFATNSIAELTRIYANLGDSAAIPGLTSDFRDIVSGRAAKFRCTPSWDFITGVGSNWGLNGK
jgi:kumamolisin